MSIGLEVNWSPAGSFFTTNLVAKEHKLLRFLHPVHKGAHMLGDRKTIKAHHLTQGGTHLYLESMLSAGLCCVHNCPSQRPHSIPLPSAPFQMKNSRIYPQFETKQLYP